MRIKQARSLCQKDVTCWRLYGMDSKVWNTSSATKIFMFHLCHWCGNFLPSTGDTTGSRWHHPMSTLDRSYFPSFNQANPMSINLLDDLPLSVGAMPGGKSKEADIGPVIMMH